MSSLFAPTQWGLVVESSERRSPAAKVALAELCQQYWPAVYAFIRGGGYSVQDAEDLTQDFFAHVLGKQWLERADRARGKFRTFLLTSVRNFLNDARDRARTEKRGGKCEFISFDLAAAEGRYTAFGTAGFAPEKTFDAQWARSLVDQALKRLREQYAEQGTERIFDVLQPFLTADSVTPYDEAAGVLGISAAAVKTNIHRLRQRYGDALREEIGRTVTDPTEVVSEIRYLCSVL